MTKIHAYLAVFLVLGSVAACGGSSSPSASNGGGSGEAGTGAAGNGSSGNGSSGNGSSGAGGGTVGPQAKSDKLDVLFVVDNSSSMAGKQKLLAASLPSFVAHLVAPPCVDDSGVPLPGEALFGGCTMGKREASPVNDIHFGVITTSLGGHGGNVVCNFVDSTHHNDDQAQLLPSKRDGVTSTMNSGYLAFDATGTAGGDSYSMLADQLAAMISATGEDGCGFEAPFEAMYRFLADPEPPLSVTVVDQVTTPMGVNSTLLAQRAAFLRPDSSVAIVILSDENDCSIADEKQGWIVGSTQRFPRATAACDTNPNDPCCRSCVAVESAPPAGCVPMVQDSVCGAQLADSIVATWDTLHDSLNLRCFDQKRRFGFDFLYPVDRYSAALTSPKIASRAGTMVDNPLFAARDGKGPRSPSLVSLSVITGVPWQDLSPSDNLTDSKLQYLDGAALEKEGRWPIVLGDPSKGIAPTDAYMVESIAPRTGQNPLTHTPIAPAASTNPKESIINGHEQNAPDLDDLQYACIFPLEKPITCGNGEICECAPDNQGSLDFVLAANSPLCQLPAGGLPGTTQYFGKGYPGVRELELARSLGVRASAASVCPKAQSTNTDLDAYMPALSALLTRLRATLN